ncbi:MAG: hypothetical protein U9Q98_12920 [Bacteroidota bacterium]|nr:hypothetical protein [Bacteroidota bacterium]
MKQYIKILRGIILTGVILTLFACPKTEPPKAIIKVINENGEPVEEAMVVIRAADSDSTHTRVYLSSGVKEIADTSYTDGDGKVRKKFLYESIYRVEVTKFGGYDNPTLRGIGVLILETDEIYEETITITPQTTF